MTVPDEAVEAAVASFFAGFTRVHPQSKADMRAALEAAAPYLRAQALEALVADSPRLPSDVRGAVFDAVFDVVEKFDFPAQNMGPHKDVVEIGDVCGEVEKRIVALLRARASAERGGEWPYSQEQLEHAVDVAMDTIERLIGGGE